MFTVPRVDWVFENINCSLDLILNWTFYILFCNYFGHSLGGVIIWTQILVANHARLWIGTANTNYPVQAEIGDGFSTANAFHDFVLGFDWFGSNFDWSSAMGFFRWLGFGGFLIVECGGRMTLEAEMDSERRGCFLIYKSWRR